MTQQDNDSPVYTVLAFCFTNRATASEVLKELKAARKLEEFNIVAEAVVEVDDKGKSHVHQHGRGGVGAAVGIMAGEALALLGGPVGLLAFAAVGGILGGAAGHFVNQAFSKDDLARLKDQLSPNSSALLTMMYNLYTEQEPDFSIPWNLDLMWSYSINQQNPQALFRSSTIMASLGFNLTESWKFNASTGYDILNHQVTAPQITIYRDLHCWEMNFSWIPVGQYRNFRVEFRLKASQLQDLKLTKQGSVRGLY